MQLMADRRRDRQESSVDSGRLTSWRDWHTAIAPTYTTAGYAECHVDFNDWLWEVADNPALPRSSVELWARGLAKSTTAELGVAMLGSRNKRSYCLYVCRTQDLADDHVRNIANICESARMAAHYPGMSARFTGKFGTSKGWRRDRISTASGFTVDALGLDTAARGAKLDEHRPDLIIFDDVDHQHDTRGAVDKKIKTITDAILMAGAVGTIVAFVQNVIHDDSVAYRLMTGTSDMLTGARVTGPVPALLPEPPPGDPNGEPSVVIQLETSADGLDKHVVLQGEPVWEGFDREACAAACDLAGLSSFLRESQHDVDEGADGLWTNLQIRKAVRPSPYIIEVGVGVDPPASKQGTCGIVAGALVDYNAGTALEPGEEYRPHYGVEIWHDRSIDGGAGVWPQVVVDTLRSLETATNIGSGFVVPEVNNGGDMVTTLIGHADPSVIVDPVRAGKGQDKEQRAAPVVGAYKQHRVIHLEDMPELVRQMTTWRITRGYSPDRLDALVWLVTRWLPYLTGVAAQIMSGSDIAGEDAATPQGGGRLGAARPTPGSSGRRLGVRGSRLG